MVATCYRQTFVNVVNIILIFIASNQIDEQKNSHKRVDLDN